MSNNNLKTFGRIATGTVAVVVQVNYGYYYYSRTVFGLHRHRPVAICRHIAHVGIYSRSRSKYRVLNIGEYLVEISNVYIIE